MKTNAKPMSRSRMVWLGILAALTALAGIVGDAVDLARSLGIEMPENVERWVLLVVGIAVIILRRMTTQPIAGAVRSPVRQEA